MKVVAAELTVCRGNILASFEQSNPARLSDELSIRFLPVFKKTRKLFAETIIPYLKERVEEK